MLTWVYPLVMLVAIGSSSLLLRTTQKRLPLTTREKVGLGIGAFCGAMLTSKLPFVFGKYEQLLAGTTWLIEGKTIMLGIVGGYLGVEFAKWVMNIKTRTGDSFAVPVAVAVAIGRLACFTAGCCHGQPTTLPWGVHFSSVDADPAIFRHPTQIYEFLFHATCAIILLVIYRRIYGNRSSSFEMRYLQGNLIKAYILVYLVYRFFSEYLRPEVIHDVGLTFYQITALVLLPVFGALWICDLFVRPITTTSRH